MSREKKSSKRKEEEESPPAKVAAKKRKIVITHGGHTTTTASPSTSSQSSSSSSSSSKSSTQTSSRNSNPPTPPPSSSSSSSSSASQSYSFKNPNYSRPTVKKKQQWKNLKQILASEPYSQLPVNIATYVNIEASPSILPSRKYCDITGHVAPYSDPRTSLRYSDSHVYKFIRSLHDESVQQYLGLRRAAVGIK